MTQHIEVTASASTTEPTSEAVAQIVADHKRTVVWRFAIIFALLVAAVIAFVVSTIVGPVDLSVRDVVVGIIDPQSLSSRDYTVLWRLRLPMSVMALLVGMALALAGAQMQTILGNPLAEPFTLGISAAAAFGGAAAIALGWTVISQPQFNLAATAWAAAMLATTMIVVAAVVRGASAETMILLGIGLVFLFQALLALIQYRATTEALQQIVFWTMGSLTRATWIANGVIGASLLLAVPLFMVLSWQLTALRLGDARARALGVNVTRLRVVVLIVVSLLAATAVAFCGIIGFVGLVGPHVARMLVGEDQRYFMPASMAAGALMLSASHAASLLIIPGLAMPIGIITALIGVPFFIVIVMAGRRALW
ncbi:iron ABC transporter permease [Corynebacterium sp.]|uniref:FecCD family ABC transporter permease n=1 Tax=Corynebacterium sp. TaxID=1720 RepID=UPI0026DD55C6|nr:iron ABC transporter permease [Corynebacterium sp.]MDO5076935.1 iron ABC transporter permease [Corynebacterium sp.]